MNCGKIKKLANSMQGVKINLSSKKGIGDF
jgi:hypothetical protein